jgi:hypothetical protein
MCPCGVLADAAWPLLFTLYSLLFTLYSLLFTLYSLLFPLHSCYIFNPTIVAPPIHLFKIIKIDANVTKFLLQKLAIIKPNLQLCKHNQLNKQTMSKKQNILVNHTPTTKIGATHCVKNTPPYQLFNNQRIIYCNDDSPHGQ